MLTAADLTFLQTTSMLTQTTPCQILRKSSVSDGMGGLTDTWVTLASVTCRIAPVLSRNQEVVDELRIEILSRWFIALPAGQDIDVKDRIVAGGITYEVMSFDAPVTFELERIVTCEEVQT